MGYSFTDLGAEGCCRSLNALFFEENAFENVGCKKIAIFSASMY